MLPLDSMVKLHRLNGKEFVVNCELIKFIESTPDTMLTLVNAEKHMVQESVDEVIEAVVLFKQKLLINKCV